MSINPKKFIHHTSLVEGILVPDDYGEGFPTSASEMEGLIHDAQERGYSDFGPCDTDFSGGDLILSNVIIRVGNEKLMAFFKRSPDWVSILPIWTRDDVVWHIKQAKQTNKERIIGAIRDEKQALFAGRVKDTMSLMATPEVLAVTGMGKMGEQEWDARPVSSRVAFAHSLGLPGTLGSKAWSNLSEAERQMLRREKPVSRDYLPTANATKAKNPLSEAPPLPEAPPSTPRTITAENVDDFIYHKGYSYTTKSGKTIHVKAHIEKKPKAGPSSLGRIS